MDSRYVFHYRRFDNHQTGTFILYKHPNLTTEVQIRFSSCSRSPIKCNCGVAVRQGFDVFVIDLCNSEWKIQYEYCGEGERILEVREITDRNYEIYFTYGTYVSVYWYGWNRYYSMSVRVYPSSQDTNAETIGLCGTLDGNQTNDFQYINGTSYTSSINGWGLRNQPIPFISDMRVSDENDLFSSNFNTSNLKPWRSHLCICTNLTRGESEGSAKLDVNIPCHKNGVLTCYQRGRPLSHRHCKGSSRHRRSVDRRPSIPHVTITNQHLPSKKFKRQTTGNWTRERATEYCQAQLNSTTAYALCQDVPNAGTEESIEACVEDIMMTDGVEWVTTNKNDMVFACAMETYRNLTLQQSADGEKSLAEQIEEIACPFYCFSNGVCEEGVCVCDDGYGGNDCSIDKHLPVAITGLLERGLCDEMLQPCDEAFVFGGAFVEGGNLSCRLEQFIIDESGNRTYANTEFVTAVYVTLIEVLCPIGNRRRKRSTNTDGVDEFVFGYTVSVSNDGQNYADGEDLFIYNSECQLVQNISNTFHFFLKVGYCFIDNQCVVHGQANPVENCSSCDTSVSTRGWSATSNDPGCMQLTSTKMTSATTSPASRTTTPFIPYSTKEEDSTDELIWIAGPVIGGIVIIIITAVVVLKMKSKRAERIGDSTVFDVPALQFNTKPKLDYTVFQR